MRAIIRNAGIVNEGKIFWSDLMIRNGRIEKIDKIIRGTGLETEIDAEGEFLFPGIIDDQVHFREPGLTQKGTIYSESKAAVAGGVTSFMEMPNTLPPATTLQLLEQKYKIAQITSLANYSFFLGTSNNNLEEVKKLNPQKICGLKIFMGSSTGQLVVDDPVALENIFRYAPTLIATHCETDSVIKANEQKFRDQYGDAIPIECHPLIRNEEQCVRSSALAISLARQHNSRLHILHISTAEELSLFDHSIPLDKKKITAEACVHHLWYDSNDYQKLGPLIKCNPAIKDPRHKRELLIAIVDDRLDMIASDHAPHLWEEKFTMTPEGELNYFKSPSGLPLVQHSINIMLEFFHRNESTPTGLPFTLEKIVEKMCHAPTICFNIKDRGFIREGYYADLILLDLYREWKVSKENIHYKCQWSPFEGQTFRGKVTHTFVNGNLVFKDDLFDESANGMRLEFER